MANYFSIPFNEQETTISFSRDEAGVSIWTNDRTVMTRLNKLCETAPDAYKCTDVGHARNGGGIMDARYYISDKRLLSFRTRIMSQNLTEEQRAARAEQMKRNRAAIAS